MLLGYSSRSSWSDDVLLETLLPLGKVDPGLRAPEIPLDLNSIAARGAASGRDRLRRAGGRGNQARSVHPAGAGGPDDADPEARHVGRDRLSAQSDRDRDERVDAAEIVPRPLYARPRHPGEGPYRATFRHALDARRAVDARICQRGSRGLGLLAERHAARRQGTALQHQSDGALVRSGPDRASRHSHPSRGGEPVDVSGGG